MGIHPTCLDSSTEFLLRSNGVFPIKFSGGLVTLDQSREVVRSQNQKAIWCAREIAPNTLCVGFFGSHGIEIYEGKELKRSVEVPGCIFALICPPSHEPQDGMPKKIIALDN